MSYSFAIKIILWAVFAVGAVVVFFMWATAHATGPGFSCCQKEMTEGDRRFCDANLDLYQACAPFPVPDKPKDQNEGPKK